MKKFNGVKIIFRNNAKALRLAAMAFFAGVLAVQAFAANTCSPYVQYTLSGCTGGTTGYATCNCTSWSESGGYSGCGIISGCY
jgi:hypothetical protein